MGGVHRTLDGTGWAGGAAEACCRQSVHPHQSVGFRAEGASGTIQGVVTRRGTTMMSLSGCMVAPAHNAHNGRAPDTQPDFVSCVSSACGAASSERVICVALGCVSKLTYDCVPLLLTPKRMADDQGVVEVSRADLHYGHRRPSRMLKLTGRDD